MNKYWQYFKTITKHKIEVGKICFIFGLYWQGLMHDMSKYGFTEFRAGANYYDSKIKTESKKQVEEGYEMAWLHHKAHNKHHHFYWMNWDVFQNPTPCKVPIKYVYEMVADWIGAGKIYNNSDTKWSWAEPYNYYRRHLRTSTTNYPVWHPDTRALMDLILVDLKEFGLRVVTANIKNGLYQKYYTAPAGSSYYNYLHSTEEYLSKKYYLGEE